MGCNYYLRLKKDYEPKDERFTGSNLQILKNGYVWNDCYYKTISELNKDYFLKLHIGKSSAGWHFLLCIYPELGIKNLDDWKKLFKDNLITDETGDIILPKDLIKNITERQKFIPEGKTLKDVENKELEDYNIFWNTCPTRIKCTNYDEYIRYNHAERGINGLWAHKTDDKTFRTNGTYDLTLDWNFS